MDLTAKVGKTQPWKILVPDVSAHSELQDICTLTDRPWARQMLAERYLQIATGERQGRYPEHDNDRCLDPFQGIYKAEALVSPFLKATSLVVFSS